MNKLTLIIDLYFMQKRRNMQFLLLELTNSLKLTKKGTVLQILLLSINKNMHNITIIFTAIYTN